MFVWDFSPEIFRIDVFGREFGPRYYGLMFVAGFTIGYFYIKNIFHKAGRNIAVEIPMLLNHLLVGTIVGARLGHCLFYDPAYYLSNPLDILKVWEGGLASHGGYIGVFVSVMIFLYRVKGLSFMWLMDRIAPPALLTGAFIRIGNFFNSEIIGKPTDAPWGVVFARLGEGYEDPRHPSMLYESFGYFLIAFLLFFLVKRYGDSWKSGRILGVTFALGWTWRFLVEFTKINQSSWEDGLVLNMGQLLSIPFIIIGILMFLGWHADKPFLRLLNEPPGKGQPGKTVVSAPAAKTKKRKH